MNGVSSFEKAIYRLLVGSTGAAAFLAVILIWGGGKDETIAKFLATAIVLVVGSAFVLAGARTVRSRRDEP